MGIIIILILVNLPWLIVGGFHLLEILDPLVLLRGMSVIGKLFTTLIAMSVAIFVLEMRYSREDPF